MKEGGSEKEEEKGKKESGRQWMRENKVKRQAKSEDDRGKIDQERRNSQEQRREQERVTEEKDEKHMKSCTLYKVLRIGNHNVVLLVKPTVYNNLLIYFQIYQKFSATRDTITECRLDVNTLVNLFS